MSKILLKILFLSLSINLFSCDKKEEIDLISEEKMMNILMDIHLAEAITGRKGGLSVHRDMLRNDLMVDILEKYEIDKETFSISYQYYMEHPVKLDSMYVRIIKIFEEKSDDSKNKPSSDSTNSQKPKTLKDVSASNSSEK